jgi:hypothetical protein
MPWQAGCCLDTSCLSRKVKSRWSFPLFHIKWHVGRESKQASNKKATPFFFLWFSALPQLPSARQPIGLIPHFPWSKADTFFSWVIRLFDFVRKSDMNSA